MTKLFIALFGALTLGALYLTVGGSAVPGPTVEQRNIRAGSIHRGGGFFLGGPGRSGGFRGGK